MVFLLLYLFQFNLYAESKDIKIELGVIEERDGMYSDNIVVELNDKQISISSNNLYTSTKIYVDMSDLDEFRSSLKKCYEKYDEWVRLAKENDIQSLEKELGISLPSVIISFLDNNKYKVEISLNKVISKPKAVFSKTLDRYYLYLFHLSEIKTIRGKYEFNFAFKTPQELKRTLELISKENIEKVLEENKNYIESEKKKDDLKETLFK